MGKATPIVCEQSMNEGDKHSCRFGVFFGIEVLLVFNFLLNTNTFNTTRQKKTAVSKITFHLRKVTLKLGQYDSYAMRLAK